MSHGSPSKSTAVKSVRTIGAPNIPAAQFTFSFFYNFISVGVFIASGSRCNHSRHCNLSGKSGTFIGFSIDSFVRNNLEIVVVTKVAAIKMSVAGSSDLPKLP